MSHPQTCDRMLSQNARIPKEFTEWTQCCDWSTASARVHYDPCSGILSLASSYFKILLLTFLRPWRASLPLMFCLFTPLDSTCGPRMSDSYVPPHDPTLNCGWSGFCSGALRLWHALPNEMRDSQSWGVFKSRLKNVFVQTGFFLFNVWYFLIVYFYLCS